jgi:two-component system, OmpR family, sensor histidine kinase KdpD
MSDSRPNPDELLARVQAEEVKQQRGKLKIFFGMAPGVGKTYAMLQAARRAATEQVDVIVGYVEPHARPETHALVLGLDLMPRRIVHYHGKATEEFDLEAALARKPELILVDELAHTNAEGSTHPKRWQDIEDLLAAGINVYTTLNVQHLESLNDVVAQVTSIPVRETVPDHVFEQADEVELVDLAPDDLIERLREGKVYVSAQASRALENFFRKGNLFALRELALRKTAERVNEQAIGYRQEHDVSRIWAISERLLVCVGPSPMSAKLVRATRRLATSLRAPWVALHVELERAKILSPADQVRLEANLRLAEELGASVDTTYGVHFADAVLKYSHRHNITKIVVGKSRMTRWQELFRGAFVNDLIRRSGDTDIYVISGEAEPPLEHKPVVEKKPTQWTPYFGAMTAVGLCTLISFGLFQLFEATNLAMVYLACVVVVSLVWGRGPSVLATILGVAAFDFFFVKPYNTFAVTDTQYVITFAVMLVTGLVISALASRVYLQTNAIRDREQRTAALFALSRELTRLPTQATVSQATQRILRDSLAVQSWIIVRHPDGTLAPADGAAGSASPQKHDGVVRWVFDHQKPAGQGTDTLPGTEGTYLPLLGADGLVGVIGVQPLDHESRLSNSQLKLFEAFAGQVAMAFERCNLAVQAEKVRLQMETERLRNTLLSAVSHDLRTPLTGITGAASLLVEGNSQLTAEARRDLANSILDESDRLNRLVANLLDMTRLEAGAIQLQPVLQPLEEVVGVVLSRLERQLRHHPVTTNLPADLPPAMIDGLLIQQVLVNLLDNAAKFSPPGTPIDLSASVRNNELAVEVADRGPGIPPAEIDRIFEKFYRIDGQSSSGTGIGLSICRGIVEMHHGKICAENRPGGGAIFRFTLPLRPTPSKT